MKTNERQDTLPTTHASTAPRILYVVSLFPCWSETFILREIIAMKELGANIEILSLKPHTEEFLQERAKGLLAYTHYPKGWFISVLALLALTLRHPSRSGGFLVMLIKGMRRQPGNLLRSIAALSRVAGQWHRICDFDPQIVHAPWATYPATVAWYISHMTGKPFSFTSRAHDILIENHMMAEKLAHTSIAITITRNNVRYMSRWMNTQNPTPIHVVHSALDLPQNRFSTEPRLPHRLLSVGRLDPIKGYDVLLSALAELQQSGVQFDSIIIGDGPERQRLEERRDELGLGSLVTIAGARPIEQVLRAMAEATVMVLPCVVTPEGNSDGIPNVLTEAMAAGLPVISTRISGIPELVDDGVSGRLVEPNDPQALAVAITTLLGDKALRDAYAKAGREKVEREFNVQIEAKKLYQLVNGVLCDAT